MKKLLLLLICLTIFLTACGETAQKEAGTFRPVGTEAVVSLDESAAKTVRAGDNGEPGPADFGRADERA